MHHSANPKHFNKNFGSCLALWDWMFGTLYVPAKEREPLTFGFADHPDAHTVKGELVDPFVNAAGHLKPLLPKRRPDFAQDFARSFRLRSATSRCLTAPCAGAPSPSTTRCRGLPLRAQAPDGRGFDPEFKPQLTPAEMLGSACSAAST